MPCILYESIPFLELDYFPILLFILRDYLLCPDYPVVHLQLLMITDPTDPWGQTPDSLVVNHDA